MSFGDPLNTVCPDHDHQHCPACGHIHIACVEAGCAFFRLECPACGQLMFWERSGILESEDLWPCILGSLVLTARQKMM